MAGTDLTNVADKELKDESEDGGAKRRHPELSASLRNIKAPPGSVVQLFLEQLTLLIEGTFLRTSGNTYTKTTGHYRLATLRRLIKFLERGIGGGGKTCLPPPTILNAPPLSHCRVTGVAPTHNFSNSLFSASRTRGRGSSIHRRQACAI